MNKLLLILAISFFPVAGLAASAEQQVNTESRTEFTGKDTVIAVGDCSMALTYLDFAGQQRIRSQFTLTVCKEKKTYDVTVTKSGKWYKWSAKVEGIPGTETYSYEIANETKGADELVNVDAILQALTVYNTCTQMRSGFAQAAQASRGTAKCQF